MALEDNKTIPIRAFVKSESRRPVDDEIDLIGKRMFAMRNGNRTDPLNNKLQEIANSLDVPYIDRESIYCDLVGQKCQVFTDGGFLMVWDADHLSVNGAKYVGEKLRNDIIDVFHMNK